MQTVAGIGDVEASLRGGTRLLNRDQRAAARQLSLAAYLLFHGGRPKDENSIRENLPPYAEIFDASPGEDGYRDRATDALRKQLARDVEALAEAAIKVKVEGEADGRRYRLSPSGFSPAELDLSSEERSVLVGALRTFRRDFPYGGPLLLAVANLIGAASAGAVDLDGSEAPNEALHAAVATWHAFATPRGLLASSPLRISSTTL